MVADEDIQKKKKLWKYAIPVLAIIVVIAMAVTAGCITGTKNTGNTAAQADESHDYRDLFPDKAYPEYAEGYSVEYHGTYKVVNIHDPWGREAENHTYLLVQRGEEVPEGYPKARVFLIPLESVITLSVVHIPQICELDETDTIRGINGLTLVHDQDVLDLAGKGEIIEIGSGALSMASTLNVEKMIELEPDAAFCTANGNPEYDNQYKLEEAGLKPAITAEWMERDPMARAEWIKYYALFFNKEKTANEAFENIKNNYTAILDKTEEVTDKPTIFSGIDYQGSWYAPGGGGYVAKLFADAGGDYILVNDNQSGDVALDFEIVYERAQDADFWINTGYGDDIVELMALDPRYSKFEAFRNEKIYHFNARLNEYGGNDYWQSGIIHPDIVLADLVKILHPELLPDHELYYYRNICISHAGENT